MQVTQKSADGLSRTFGVTVAVDELSALLEARIDEVTPTLRLKGFRPGKVPKAHVRRLYGKALMGEVLEKTLSETSQKVVADNQLRIAAQPRLEPQSDLDQVIAGQADLAFEVSVEVMPDFEPADITALKLERPVLAVTEAEIDAALQALADENRIYEDRAGANLTARPGDQLVIDFAGTIDGQPFEGGRAQDVEVVLGQGRFLPGFEEQLEGAAPGAKVEVVTAFPADYGVDRLKGQTARFEVEVKAVRAPKAAQVDEALAQRLGMADLAALKAAIRSNQEREYGAQSRMKVKRALLDALDAAHAIELPSRMVEAEFDGIWRQLEHEREHGHLAEEDQGKSEETLRSEYGKIAERRVRLGLVLAEIGRRAEIQVTEQELSDAMRREAVRYGDQAKAVFDMLRNNPQAQAQLRAPIYEEKVVDYIVERAQVTDIPVSKEALFAEDELPPSIAEAGAPDAGSGKGRPAKARGKAAAASKTAGREPKTKETAAVAEPTATKAPKGEPKAKAKTASAVAEPAAVKAPKDKPKARETAGTAPAKPTAKKARPAKS